MGIKRKVIRKRQSVVHQKPGLRALPPDAAVSGWREYAQPGSQRPALPAPSAGQGQPAELAPAPFSDPIFIDPDDEDDDPPKTVQPSVALVPASRAPAVVPPYVLPPQPPVLVGDGDPVTVTVTVKRGAPSGRPIKDALVVVKSVGVDEEERWTNYRGIARFTMLTGTAYKILCYKDWFLPEPREVDFTPVAAGNVDVELEEVHFYLHVDADRDGYVDRERAEDRWTWGQDSYGAVILCNMDRDDNRQPPHIDSEDDRINTRTDLRDIAPLEIRRRGYAAAPGNWIIELSILDRHNEYVRIFDGLEGDSRQIVGPGQDNHIFLDPHLLTVKTLGMEALQFAHEHWDGYARIELRVRKNHSCGKWRVRSYSSIAKVRVAPWLMPGPDEEATRVYAVATNDNAVFLDKVKTQVEQSGAEWQTTGCADRWMQDCMEIGFSLLPKKDRAHRVACTARALRHRGLFSYPPTLVERDFGYCDPFSDPLAIETTFDSFGNLEVTPPVKRPGDGKEFPWGRIYYGPGTRGPGFNASVASFLDRQIVQEPFTLNTDWLAVGHVDEMMTFLHYSGGSRWKKWKLLIASPTEAYRIVREVHGQDATAKLLTNRRLYFNDVPLPVECTVDTFLNGVTPIPNPFDGTFISGAALETFNTDTIHNYLEGVLDDLEIEIGLDRVADVIKVPVIFMPDNPAWTMSSALTADMVNMLILKDRCLVPAPFGPVLGGIDQFRKALTDALTLNQTWPRGVRFINDWYTYHALLGEIHCGTNSLRRPRDLHRWLTSDKAKWWTFGH